MLDDLFPCASVFSSSGSRNAGAQSVLSSLFAQMKELMSRQEKCLGDRFHA